MFSLMYFICFTVLNSMRLKIPIPSISLNFAFVVLCSSNNCNQVPCLNAHATDPHFFFTFQQKKIWFSFFSSFHLVRWIEYKMCASTWLHYVYPLKKISSWISIGSEPAKFGARDCITIYMPVNQKKSGIACVRIVWYFTDWRLTFGAFVICEWLRLVKIASLLLMLPFALTPFCIEINLELGGTSKSYDNIYSMHNLVVQSELVRWNDRNWRKQVPELRSIAFQSN